MWRASVCVHQATMAHSAKDVSRNDYQKLRYQLKSIKWYVNIFSGLLEGQDGSKIIKYKIKQTDLDWMKQMYNPL